MKVLPQDNEAAMVEVFRQYRILDTEPEAAFDDLTHLAAQICNTPIALVSLIDECRQWFRSKVGLEATTSREVVFCDHATLQPDVLVVPDTLSEPQFATNPLVTAEPQIRFYASAPLITSQGYALGALCVIDHVPRGLSSEQVKALRIG